jgi:hypothetical protein
MHTDSERTRTTETLEEQSSPEQAQRRENQERPETQQAPADTALDEIQNREAQPDQTQMRLTRYCSRLIRELTLEAAHKPQLEPRQKTSPARSDTDEVYTVPHEAYTPIDVQG